MAWLCLYPSNRSIQRPDSQVNNCSMCPSFFGMFINKLWCNNDVALMTLHCVSCRVGSLHLLGSSFKTLENICTKFTHVSQKWFYFSVHYTLYLHISLWRCNWLRCREGRFFGPHCMCCLHIVQCIDCVHRSSELCWLWDCDGVLLMQTCQVEQLSQYHALWSSETT